MNDNIPVSIKLKVITSSKLLIEADVSEVTFPGLDGYLGILPGHRLLLTALGEGTLAYKRDKRESAFQVRGGYAEVYPDKVFIFTDLKEDDAGQAAQE